MYDLDELKPPYIPPDLIEYLEKSFAYSQILYDDRVGGSDEKIGYMKGVHCVIEHLKAVREEQTDVSV